MNKFGKTGQIILLLCTGLLLSGCKTTDPAASKDAPVSFSRSDTYGASQEAIIVAALFDQDASSDPAVDRFYDYFKSKGQPGQECIRATDRRRCELDAYAGAMEDLWKCAMPTATVAAVMTVGTLSVTKYSKIRRLSHGLAGYTELLTRIIKQYQADPVDKEKLESLRRTYAAKASQQNFVEQIQATKKCMIYDQNLTSFIGKGPL
ncbi:hypothetical protein O4H49_03810 [Kiloniella laminariae]|uniref:Lipoprotein n=1 Tax=Kiloniella laminariae TaxID=454162 RepID=A0ABT4LFL8_9PROT|nr:hypothetical protein [Kiloniella laminariae]MCZ4279889.1 hypothetical protein [Kiloniella laminariae]